MSSDKPLPFVYQFAAGYDTLPAPQAVLQHWDHTVQARRDKCSVPGRVDWSYDGNF